jgi:drug/metabolite transporter (DMT)-like permease
MLRYIPNSAIFVAFIYNMSSRLRGILFASIAAVLWGFLAIALKVSLKSFSPIEISWIRFVIAFTVLTVYYVFYSPGSFTIFKKPPGLLLLAGMMLGLNYLGFITGIHYTTPGIAQVFIQLGPIFLTIAAFVFFKEKASVKQVIGLVIAFSGLSLFYHEQLSVLIGDVKLFNKGILWVIFGALCWTCYAILQKRLVIKHNPMQLNLVLFGVPALLYIPFVQFEKFAGISTGYIFLLMFLGLNTLGAYGSLAYALKYLEANKISVILIQNPIITFIVLIMMDYLQITWIKNEQFTLLTIIGAIMVIAGGVLTVFVNKRKRNNK